MNSYNILNVTKNSTKSEVVTAYRARIKKCHPDVGGDLEEFLQVKDAYEIILADIECYENCSWLRKILHRGNRVH